MLWVKKGMPNPSNLTRTEIYLAMLVEAPDKVSNDELFENPPCKSRQELQNFRVLKEEE